MFMLKQSENLKKIEDLKVNGLKWESILCASKLGFNP